MHQIPQLSGIYSWESILGSPHENQIWNVKYHINRKKKRIPRWRLERGSRKHAP
jgi:hypothetical protein